MNEVDVIVLGDCDLWGGATIYNAAMNYLKSNGKIYIHSNSKIRHDKSVAGCNVSDVWMCHPSEKHPPKNVNLRIIDSVSIQVEIDVISILRRY